MNRCLLVAVVCAIWGSSGVAAGHGKIVAVPHGAFIPDGAVPLPSGMRMPAKAVAEATRRARSSGRSVSVDVPAQALPSLANHQALASSKDASSSSSPSLSHTLGKKESHKQKMAASTDAQVR